MALTGLCAIAEEPIVYLQPHGLETQSYLRGEELDKILEDIRAGLPVPVEVDLASDNALAWIEDIYSMCANGQIDAALDTLYRTINAYLTDGRFSACDSALKSIDLGRMDSNLMVALLTSTLPAKEQLPFRPQLYASVERHLRERSTPRVDRLLLGLQ